MQSISQHTQFAEARYELTCFGDTMRCAGEVVRPKIDKVFMRWDDGVKFRVNLFDNETWDAGRSFALVAGTTFRHVKMTRKEVSHCL